MLSLMAKAQPVQHLGECAGLGLRFTSLSAKYAVFTKGRAV